MVGSSLVWGRDTWAVRKLNRIAMIWGICLIMTGGAALAETIILLDFDGSVVNFRKDLGGSFETTYRIFRLTYRANTLQAIPSGPEYLDVSGGELFEIRNQLAAGEGKPGTLNKTYTLRSGLKFTPGEYFLKDPESYFRFFAAPKGSNYLLEDFKAAEARDRSGKSWQGRFWDPMTKILSTQEGANALSLISARGHSHEEWVEFFEYLRSQGYIKFVPKRFMSISTREFDRFSLTGDVTAQKMGVAEEVALRVLAFKPVTEKDLRLNPDGDGMGYYHGLLLIEDDPRTVDAVVHAFRGLAQSKLAPIKFGVFHMGPDQEVKDWGKPRFTILTDDGVYRPARGKEILGDLNIPEGKVKTMSRPRGHQTCRGSVSKARGAS